MGSIVTKGTRLRPRYYGKLKVDGRWTMRALPGCRNMRDAAFMLAEMERRVAMGQPPLPPPEKPKETAGELLTKWAASLKNRAADSDRWRIEKHLRPTFRNMALDQITLRAVLGWLGEMEDAGLGAQVRLHNFGTLSRFLGWCIERGLVDLNVCRSVPRGRRPRVKIDREQPWIESDETVLQVMAEIEPPIGLLFYIGNRCGLRLGEVCGLRLSDLGWLGEGTIRVRFSYGGPLKEDKEGAGKVKWVPAPDDATKLLGPWLAQRRADGANAEDVVFPYKAPKPQNKRRSKAWKGWPGYHPHYIQNRWNSTAEQLGLQVTWYQATRHSFATRSLVQGASLDEVSAALGHHHPVVTRKHYDHFIRKQFSEILRKPLHRPGESGGDGQP